MSFSTEDRLCSVVNLDVSMMFWKQREFNNLGVGHFVPAVPSAREKCQVCLLIHTQQSNIKVELAAAGWFSSCL